MTIRTNYWLDWTGAWDTVVLKETKLWEKWLPKGSTVDWKRNLEGPPVITDLVANKQNVGYIGDNPSIVATTKRDLAPKKQEILIARRTVTKYREMLGVPPSTRRKQII